MAMENLKIVLIDDEALAVENLREEIARIAGPYEIVGTASNGMQGLGLIRETAPDVAFVDIKMPVLDGLGLAKKVRQEGLPTELVIVSAYQEFEYAKQGMALGISSYLLKHEMGAGQIARLLEKLGRKIFLQRQNYAFSQQSVLAAIVNGNYVDPQIRQLFTEGELHNLSILIVRAERPLRLLETPDPPSPSFRLDETIHRQKEELRIFCVIPYRDDAYLVLFERPFVSYLMRLQALRDCASRIRRSCLNQTRGCISIAALLDEMPLSRISQAAQCVYDQLDRHSLRREELVLVSAADSQPPLGAEIGAEAFLGLLEQKDRPGLRQYLADVAARLASGRYSRAGAEKALREITWRLRQFRRDKGMPPLEQAMQPPPIYDAEAAGEWLLQAAEHTLQESESLLEANSKKLRDALAYIQKHFRQDITQQQVADALGFSGVYLSLLFRRELGISFLEYVTKCRMDAAKYDLLHTNKKIYEISEDAGYLTSQYFSRVFKQQTGLTPAQYREKGGGAK